MDLQLFGGVAKTFKHIFHGSAARVIHAAQATPSTPKVYEQAAGSTVVNTMNDAANEANAENQRRRRGFRDTVTNAGLTKVTTDQMKRALLGE